tara:strand:+ start:583 stop:873 length:291 start_codon:yes stop_codon:yes gene_type:complete
MSNEKKKEPAKKKCPTALKRIKQSVAKNKNNSAFKSRVRTSIRSFEKAVKDKDQAKISSALSFVYKLMDKGVKKGVFKANKAIRTKSKLAVAKNAV